MAEFTKYTGRGGKYKRHQYYRRPDEGEQRRWIVVAGRQDMEDMLILGFEPLMKYGLLPECIPGTNEPETNIWRHILNHPDGPAEFPVEQVMVSKWYKKEECPVPYKEGLFPQLLGHKVKEYKCPECSRRFTAIDGFGGVEPLGKHLRLIHSWDRASIVKYGEKVGIDFDAIWASISTEVEFGETKEPPKEETKEDSLIVGEFECSCGWKPKGNAKRPATALKMHSRTHLEPVPA